MKAKTLPATTIIVIENDDGIRDNLIRSVRALADYVIGFPESNSATQFFENAKETSERELLLVLGDRVGIPFMGRVGRGRSSFPLARKVLYSGGATPAAAEEWKRLGIIDSFVAKGYVSELMTEVNRSLASYHEVLTDIRHYVEGGCSRPTAPYYPTDDGRILSIIEVYKEIMLGTPTGNEAAESWLEMRRLESPGASSASN